jgi:hypothetical protein
VALLLAAFCANFPLPQPSAPATSASLSTNFQVTLPGAMPRCANAPGASVTT